MARFNNTAQNPVLLNTVGLWLMYFEIPTLPQLPPSATASQYLEAPEQVFAEVARVLRQDTGLVVISFTNKFFYQKALSGWIERGMATRARLVRDYLRAAGGFTSIEVVGSGTGLLAQVASISGLGDDPFCAVVARRDGT